MTHSRCQKNKKVRERSGFTLIEVVVVMAILVTLLGFVYIKLNTIGRTQDAYDIKRLAAVREINNAVSLYVIDNLRLPSSVPTGTEDDAKDICQETVTGSACTDSPVNGVDLSDLTPDYLTAIPIDPAMTGSTVTGYKIYSDGSDTLTIATLLGSSAVQPDYETGGGDGGGGNPSLVAHWGFNDALGTIVADETGNGHDGSITNGPAWTTGIFDGGIQLDGSNDYMSVADDSALDGFTEFTLSAWIQPYSHENTQIVGIDDAYGIKLKNDGRIEYFVTSVISNTTSVSYVPLTHHWTHLALTYDGTKARLYVNGVEDSFTNGTGTIAETTTNFNIGGANYYHGKIDEVKLYNTSLSSAEVATLTEPGFTNSQLAYWKFDDGAGTSASDSSGNGNTATLVNGPAWTSTSTPPSIFSNSHSLSFDGSNDRVDIPNTILNGATNVTSTFWIKTSKFGTQVIISGARYGNANEYLISYVEYRRYWWYPIERYLHLVSTGMDHSWSISPLTDNAWHHIAIVRDDSNDLVTAYFDGANLGTKTGSIGALSIAANGLLIGQHQSSVGGGFSSGEALQGLLDDVHIYNRLLSAAEISSLASGNELPF